MMTDGKHDVNPNVSILLTTRKHFVVSSRPENRLCWLSSLLYTYSRRTTERETINLLVQLPISLPYRAHAGEHRGQNWHMSGVIFSYE